MQALWNQDFANHSALVEAGIVPRWFCCFAMRGPSEGFVRQGRGQLKTSRLNICPEGAALHLGLGRAYLCVLFEKIWCSPPSDHAFQSNVSYCATSLAPSVTSLTAGADPHILWIPGLQAIQEMFGTAFVVLYGDIWAPHPLLVSSSGRKSCYTSSMKVKVGKRRNIPPTWFLFSPLRASRATPPAAGSALDMVS